MQVTFNIPDNVVAEVTAIALSEGFPNAKALVIHWLGAKIRVYREGKAVETAREAVSTVDVVID